MKKKYTKLFFGLIFLPLTSVYAEIDMRFSTGIVTGLLVGGAIVYLYLTDVHEKKSRALEAKNAAKDIIIEVQQQKLARFQSSIEELLALAKESTKRVSRLPKNEHELDAYFVR